MAQTQIPVSSLEKIASGKVRDLFKLPDADTLLFVASDRVSAFDVVMKNGIPDKGKILNLISAHWFKVLTERIPDLRTHFITLDVPAGVTPEEAKAIKDRSMQVRRLQVVKLESIVRGYLTGSAFKEYKKSGTVHGISVEPGMEEAQKFKQPLWTPSTKADAGEHDENIHPDDAWKEVGDRETADRVKELSLKIYEEASKYAEERGIILADTKFEFAKDAEGNIYLVDEVLTPDSSRFWPAAGYMPGRDQDSFDKQFIRNWLIKEGLKGKDGVSLPEEIVQATSDRYREAFLMLTGKRFEDAVSQ
ncbi:Phosphoribosylaminoimidazole-succinocarboxamide synthase [Fusarium falciforme]|uniref:Phosphoribosylaminoimidazole-succinocarboxamide synthase n=1 Tax=Fusarium falciforme TaxID=195108 RepID=A0A9W8RCQ3_9HYPO|nr:Phosphoribosylaminoimidazole-succinocarboxamide synthase [Fusarium falciforme]KAI8687259.1 Phosphoribosylaminoimidazole-succinocarboxamide synthase [Fusarium sp. Ph1]KAJ4192688.1 Bifunctional purine biosynthetic protein ade1 [Fusarium falciforme]KAJ4210526.1 Bifunctional purine biosynthetic protein ade1 [Fusarium falciforme]KAJ4250462.1 Bifunctional purine biosynthetic protein ade1 [Fusarium falciforme]WAO85656.1 Phosphoribosylaminoimidazole-succinocarboxamide synthase [Fusarium falciforme]